MTRNFCQGKVFPPNALGAREAEVGSHAVADPHTGEQYLRIGSSNL